MRIGLAEYTIYESAIEEGYRAGITAHRLFLRDHDRTIPVALDDKQFTMIIRQVLPRIFRLLIRGCGVPFYCGLMSICLGITADVE